MRGERRALFRISWEVSRRLTTDAPRRALAVWALCAQVSADGAGAASRRGFRHVRSGGPGAVPRVDCGRVALLGGRLSLVGSGRVTASRAVGARRDPASARRAFAAVWRFVDSRRVDTQPRGSKDHQSFVRVYHVNPNLIPGKLYK